MASRLTVDAIDFKQYLAETEHDHRIRRAGVFVSELVQRFHDPKELAGDKLPWPKTHELVRFRPGEVSLWTGLSGHGKSLLLGQACLSLAAQGRSVCIASLEMMPAVTLQRMCRQAFGDRLPDPAFIRRFSDFTNRRIWFYDQQGTIKAATMLAICRYAADSLKIQHIVIDSLLKCGVREDDLDAQKDFLDGLTACARDHGTHVHLVAHSRKLENELRPPGKADVRGASAITDQCDNIFSVWRNRVKEQAADQDFTGKPVDPKAPDCLLTVCKNRNGEFEGAIRLWFDPRSQQFTENGIDAPADLLGLHQSGLRAAA